MTFEEWFEKYTKSTNADVFDLQRAWNAALATANERFAAEREVSDRLVAALTKLVSGLDSATWSSWQTTAKFQKQWDAAHAALAEIAHIRSQESRLRSRGSQQ